MEDNIQEFVHFSKLLEIYKDLLPLSQQKVLDYYYNFNLSLKEIAEEENISRNGVYDALNKGKENLLKYESKLHIEKSMIKIDKVLMKLKEKLNQEDYLEIEKILKEE